MSDASGGQKPQPRPPPSSVTGKRAEKPAEKTEAPVELPLRHKWIITAVIYLSYFAFGLSYSLIGSTMLDIAENTHSSFTQVTWGLVVRSVTYCIGSLAFGYGFERVNREIGFAISLIGVAIPLFVQPFIRSLHLYWLSETSIGFFSAAMDVAPNTWIMEIWESWSNPPLQGMHSTFALGQCLAPLLAEPFLSSQNSGNDTTGCQANTTTPEPPANTTTTCKPSLIVVPYSLSAAVLLVAAASLFLLSNRLPYLVPSQAERNRRREQREGQQLSPETRKYHWIVVILGCLLFMVYSGIEYNSFTFFLTFIVNLPDMGLNKSTGARMSAVMSFFYFAGRVSSIYVATRVKTKNMLVMHLALAGIGNLLLYVGAVVHSVSLIYVSVIITGYGYSSMCPGFYAFLEDRISITNTICGYFMFASTISSIGNTFAMGQWMEGHPLVLVYANIVNLAVCYLVMAAFYFTDRRFKRRRNVDHGKDPSASSVLVNHSPT